MSKTKYSERVTPMGIPNTRLADLPDLIEIQKKSFEWFLKEGLKDELLSFSPIKDYTGRLELHFLPNYTFDNPKYKPAFRNTVRSYTCLCCTSSINNYHVRLFIG